MLQQGDDDARFHEFWNKPEMIDLKQTEIYVYEKRKKKSLKRIPTDPEQNNTKNNNRDDLNQRFHFWKEPHTKNKNKKHKNPQK